MGVLGDLMRATSKQTALHSNLLRAYQKIGSGKQAKERFGRQRRRAHASAPAAAPQLRGGAAGQALRTAAGQALRTAAGQALRTAAGQALRTAAGRRCLCLAAPAPPALHARRSNRALRASNKGFLKPLTSGRPSTWQSTAAHLPRWEGPRRRWQPASTHAHTRGAGGGKRRRRQPQQQQARGLEGRRRPSPP